MALSHKVATCLLVAVAALSYASAQVGSDCITSYSNTTNYFPFGYSASEPFALPVEQTIETAQKFSVQYDNAYKLVFNTFSNTSYLLYQCGAPASNDVNASVKPIQIPVTAAAIDSTIQIGYFELLGLLPVLKADSEDYTSAYASSPCFQKLVEMGNIDELNATEKFTDFQGIVFSSLQSTPVYNSNYVYFDASQDPGPLKRAEWIKYLGVFFNLEAQAVDVYNQIEENYQCLNGSNNLTTKPVVAWISEYPEGVFSFSDAAYKAQLVLDAGGANLDSSAIKEYNISKAADAAGLYKVLSGVDVLIDEIFALVPSAYNLSTLLGKLNITAAGNYSFLANKRVWREDRRLHKDSLGLDWYEGSIPQPQIVLQELLGIVNPTFTHTHHFLRNIAAGEKVVPLTADDCTAANPAAALQPTIYTCPTKVAEGGGGAVSAPSPAPAASTPAPPPSAGTKGASPMGATIVALLVSASAFLAFFI